MLTRANADRLAIAVLSLMGIGILGDLWFSPGEVVASHRTGDTARYFVFARQFGYQELAAGNLALWNPHLFSGTHFVGAFQPAMLYPPNLVYLVLPVAAGLNFEMALHLFLLAVFSYGWVRSLGLSWPAALVSAAIVTFGATASLRVLAGQLSVIDSIAWVPLLLRCIDELSRRASLPWTLAAGLGTTMILLAGHPPTVFMTAIALTLYCIPALIHCEERGRFVASLGSMAIVSLLLAGVQLAMGFEAARESVREAGMSLDFATSFSLPPENLLTSVIPYLFGTATAPQTEYFGRWWYWDDSVFIGVSALTLAALGIGSQRKPVARRALTLAIVLTVLALGRYTPIYVLLYSVLPGFDLLRSPSKFMFFAMLFVALLAGLGVERLFAERAPETPGQVLRNWRKASAILTAFGALTLGIGLWVSPTHIEPSSISTPIEWLASLDDRHAFSPQQIERWHAIARPSILISGGLMLVVALIVFAAGRRPQAAWLIVALCLMELFFFARTNRGGVRPEVWFREPDARAFAAAGEGRILERSRLSNYAMTARGYSVWGYDPVILARTVQFMARAQGLQVTDLNNVGGRIPSRHTPLMRLLRTHAAVALSGTIREVSGGIERFSLIGDHRVVRDSTAMLDAMQHEDFDPRALVYLESAPDPLPAGGSVSGSIQAQDTSTDAMTIEVTIDKPAILLISDAWAQGWRARAAPESDQQEYRVQPANLMLRAIALEAGKHIIHLEYAPAAYRIGKALSLSGGLIALASVIVWLRGRRP